jgi:hypothetical protein
MFGDSTISVLGAMNRLGCGNVGVIQVIQVVSSHLRGNTPLFIGGVEDHLNHLNHPDYP